jgi:uncharacterized damage-inducible protein DinB
MLFLYEYNYWSNRRILSAAATLNPEQFLAPAGYGRGGVRGTLTHTLDGEYSWRMLLQFNTMTFDMTEAEFPTFEALKTRWEDEEKAMRAYLAGLSEEEMNGIVRYTIEGGLKRQRIRWHCLLHVVNHGTQHRSEAAALLTGFDRSPGDIDFTMFLNERA